MKFVAARCPSCGAKIEVNEQVKFTECRYCNNQILVDDAINKYKVEVSGKLTIENMPKFENYLKLGERYYNDGDYDEAYEIYSKAIELSPDNYIVVLRLGLTKSLCTSYFDLDINSALKGMKNAYKILEGQNKKEEINRCIVECSIVFSKLRGVVLDFYNSNNLNYDGVMMYVGKLIVCLNSFEYLNTIVVDNVHLKRNILNNIIETINMILDGKRYTTDYYDKKGRPITKTFKLNYVEVNELINKKNKYLNEMMTIEGNNGEQNGNSNDENITIINNQYNKNNLKFENIICYVMIAISAIFVLIGIINRYIFSCIVWIMSLLLFIPKTKQLILDSKPDFNIPIIVCRYLIPFIGFISLIVSLPTVFEGKWVSVDNTLLVELNDGNANITLQNGIMIQGKYTSEYNNDIYIINVDVTNDNNMNENNYKFKYQKIDEEEIFCLIEDNICVKYFVSDDY